MVAEKKAMAVVECLGQNLVSLLFLLPFLFYIFSSFNFNLNLDFFLHFHPMFKCTIQRNRHDANYCLIYENVFRYTTYTQKMYFKKVISNLKSLLKYTLT